MRLNATKKYNKKKRDRETEREKQTNKQTDKGTDSSDQKLRVSVSNHSPTCCLKITDIRLYQPIFS